LCIGGLEESQMAVSIATKIVDCDSHFVPRVDLESLEDLLPVA